LGSDFVLSSRARWNGAILPSGYTGPGALHAIIPAADLATGGEFEVSVVNPAPEGGVSAALTYRISSFALSAPNPSQAVTPGQAASYTVRVTPRFGSFDAPIAFSSIRLPTGCSASFSPQVGTPGPNVMDVVLTVRTKAASGSAALGAAATSLPGGLFATALGLIVLLTYRFSLAPKLRSWMAAAAIAALIVTAASCGAGGDGDHGGTGTPPGTYEIAVNAISGTLLQTMPVTLIVR
ncbi:MAG: hypothetical protein ACM32H_01880, partial [Candidatus Aminicenantes bacterium RBG_16_66_30]